MVLDFTRHEMGLLSSLLQTRLDELSPIKTEHRAHAAFGTAKDELETLLHLKERLEFALMGHVTQEGIPHNILYSDSFAPDDEDFAPGHRHASSSPPH
jgi:hypothetical protein